MITHTRTLIAGGGFAGIQAARALVRSGQRHDILLVDCNDYFTMVPSLPDLASGRVGEHMVKTPLAAILPGQVVFKRETIHTIDLPNHVAHGAHTSFEYEALIIACGSRAETHGLTLPEYAHTLDSMTSAIRIRGELPRYLARRGAAGHVLISGAGYTGIELAMCLRWMADRAGVSIPVTVLDPADRYLPFLAPAQFRRVRKALDRARIRVLLNTGVREITPDGVSLTSGAGFEQPFFCWTAGTRLSIDTVNGDTGRLTDGRLVVNDCLQLGNYPEVMVAGDAAAWGGPDRFLRRAVNFAIGAGDRAGANTARVFRRMPPQAFKPVDLGWVIPLATSSTGTIFGRIPVGGRTGLRLHYLLSAYRSCTVAQKMRFLGLVFRPTW